MSSYAKISLPGPDIKPLASKDDYYDWTRNMTNWLRFNGLKGFADGTKPRPTGPTTRTTDIESEIELWEQLDAKASAGILSKLDAGPHQKVVDLKTAQEIWDKLKQDYQPTGTVVFTSATKELLKCKAEQFDNVQLFGDKLRNLQLQIHRVVPATTIQDTLLKLLFLENLTSYFDSWVAGFKANHDITLEEGKGITFDDLVKRASAYEGEKTSNNSSTLFTPSSQNSRAQPSQNSRERPRRSRPRKPIRPICKWCGKRDIRHTDEECDLRPEDPPEKRQKTHNHSLEQPATLQATVDEIEGYAFMVSTQTSSSDWFLDSGADKHICYQKEYFSTLDTSFKGRMGWVEPAVSAQIEGKGTVHLPLQSGKTLTLRNVLYVPTSDTHLISQALLFDDGHELKWTRDGNTFTFRKNNISVATGQRKAGTGRFTFNISPHRSPRAMIAHGLPNQPAKQLWHQRMAHLGEDNLERLKTMVDGMDISKDASQPICDVCIKGKAKRKPHNHSLPKATRPMMRIHSDVAGPISPPGLFGERYVLTFKDDLTKLIHVTLLKDRDKETIIRAYREYKACYENKGHGPIVFFHCDGGGEYINKVLEEEFKNTGVEVEQTCTDSPEQNGLSEQLNSTLLARTRAVISGKSLPKNLWSEIIKGVVYITNRCPVVGQDVTPFEAFFKARPNIANIRILGCAAWGIPPSHDGKLADRARKMTLVGFEGTTIYRLYDPNHKALVRRMNDVDFDELPTLKRAAEEIEPLDTQQVCLSSGGEDDNIEQENRRSTRSTLRKRARIASQDEDIVRNQRIEEDEDTITVRTHLTTETEAQLPSDFYCLASLITNLETPQTFQQAMDTPEREHWRKAAESEHNSHCKMGTWILVHPPKNAHILKGRWVFRAKLGPNGEIVKFKARWVARGDKQIAGIDYEEVFSSVVKSMTYKLQLNRAAVEDLEVEQMDFDTAFLNSELEEIVYVEQPHGFNDGTGRVCLLRRALYGLKQAPRAWYQTLAKYLEEELNMHACRNDISVFINEDLQISIYVDDILIFGKDKKRIQEIKNKLARRFNMKDLGPVTWYLGIHIIRDRTARTITLSQRAYFEKILQRFEMSDCKPASIPVKPNTRPRKSERDRGQEFNTKYQQITGSLMYGMYCTRPDLAFITGLLSRFNHCPDTTHLNLARNVLAYTKGTIDYALILGGHKDPRPLQGFTDAAYKDCPNSSKSTSGYVFSAGSGAISWSSRLQTTIATSTTHAEFIGQYNATKEALFLRGLAEEIWPAVVRAPTQITNEIGLPLIDPTDTPATTIFGDNNGALGIGKSIGQHAKSKHFDPHNVRYCQEHQKAKEVDFKRINTEDNTADILTKALDKHTFERHRKELGVMKIPGGGDLSDNEGTAVEGEC